MSGVEHRASGVGDLGCRLQSGTGWAAASMVAVAMAVAVDPQCGERWIAGWVCRVNDGDYRRQRVNGERADWGARVAAVGERELDREKGSVESVDGRAWITITGGVSIITPVRTARATASSGLYGQRLATDSA